MYFLYFIESLCLLNPCTSSADCVCICTYNLCKCVFPVLSHLCPLVFHCMQQCQVEVCCSNDRWDLSSLLLLLSFLSLSHSRSLLLLVSQCASMCHSPWLFTCIRLDTLNSLFAKNRTSGDHFSVSSSSLESHLCVNRVCGRIQSEI